MKYKACQCSWSYVIFDPAINDISFPPHQLSCSQLNSSDKDLLRTCMGLLLCFPVLGCSDGFPCALSTKPGAAQQAVSVVAGHANSAY